MIGTIDVKINAAHPNLPLAPLFVFVNSPAAPRVLNVPKKIGNWELTKVYASATFPDNTTRTVEMKNVAGCYVGTIPACEATGSSEGGFQITADGHDENGNAVTGYCMGRGDLFVLDRDGQITSAGVRYFFHFVDTVPEHPNKGDTAVIAGTLKWFNGTAWVQFGGSSDVTIDDTVTRTSANPVKSSGIWSAIWGALTALPSGFSSLYDWCAAQIAALQDGKRDKTDTNVYKNSFSQWSFSGRDYDSGNTYSIEEAAQSETEFDYYLYRNGDTFAVVTGKPKGLLRIDFSRGVTTELSRDVIAERTRELSPSGKLLAADNPQPASGALAKFAADGKMVAATKSSTASDPANADYRDPQDNTCHKTELGEWTFSGADVEAGKTYSIRISEGEIYGDYDLYIDGVYSGDTVEEYKDYQIRTNVKFPEKDITATRSAVCTNGKKFVTEDVAAKQAAIFGNDGKPSDQFATNLLSKRVAISAMHYALGTAITASAKLADRTTNFVNALSTLTDPIDLTFPDLVTGKCRDFLVRVHRATGGVAVGFTVPTGAVVYGDGFSTAIGENEDWLFAITETAANEWYVRAIKLEVAA